MAQCGGFSAGEGGEQVGHEAVVGPVATADDVAGAGGGQRDALAGQEGCPHLLGDATKARKVLGWKPEVDFESLVKMMVDADLARWKALMR